MLNKINFYILRHFNLHIQKRSTMLELVSEKTTILSKYERVLVEKEMDIDSLISSLIVVAKYSEDLETMLEVR